MQCQTGTVKGSVFQVESLASNSKLSTRSGGLQSWCGGGAASALRRITVVKDFSARRLHGHAVSTYCTCSERSLW